MESAASPTVAAEITERTPLRGHLALVLVAVAVAAGAGEGLLRLAWHRPWQPAVRFPNEPVMHQPDPILGWKTKPGRYVFPGYVKDAPSITFTIWPDGRRATAARPEQRDARIVLVGDSFTEGWAVSDDDTYAWKLQARFPELAVQNWGAAGYSTYQSLLRLKLALKAPDPRPLAVVYGFLDAHELRNVADDGWLQLLAKSAQRGLVELPYCLVRAGHLERHPPEAYPMWPLHEVSAAVTQMESAYAGLRARDRPAQARRVTEQLLERMARTSRLHGAKFFVVLLGTPLTRAHYVPFLSTRGIRVIDCDYPWSPATSVPGEGHPNGVRHSEWAQCIGARLASEVAL